MKGGTPMRFFQIIIGIFTALSVSASNALATTSSWDMSSITSTFTQAGTDLKAFILVVLGVLAVLWVGRKFIKTTNGS